MLPTRKKSDWKPLDKEALQRICVSYFRKLADCQKTLEATVDASEACEDEMWIKLMAVLIHQLTPIAIPQKHMVFEEAQWVPSEWILKGIFGEIPPASDQLLDKLEYGRCFSRYIRKGQVIRNEMSLEGRLFHHVEMEMHFAIQSCLHLSIVMAREHAAAALGLIVSYQKHYQTIGDSK